MIRRICEGLIDALWMLLMLAALLPLLIIGRLCGLDLDE